jgi:hypothetical protein
MLQLKIIFQDNRDCLLSNVLMEPEFNQPKVLFHYAAEKYHRKHRKEYLLIQQKI